MSAVMNTSLPSIVTTGTPDKYTIILLFLTLIYIA